ncbi:MAG: pentapeptide repeat-containing protein [Salinisphaera sp.]|nr:pentapeptide repeat-containing protein [Salinisphaera sp.]
MTDPFVLRLSKDERRVFPQSAREQATLGSVALVIGATLLTAILFLTGRAMSAAAVAPTPACPASLVAGGHDYHGLTLTMCNFTGQDLTNANFNGATLTAVIFIKTILTGADFTGATFADSGNATLPTDFSFATLTNAKFIGAKFNGATYLTYATLTCADFSSPASGTMDLNNGNAIFGDDPLVIDTSQSCRTKFQQTIMNCEFVAQWNQLDMSNAKIAACTDQLQTVQGKGHDFSGGMYSGVLFDNLDLTASTWTGAMLEHASFQGATLDNATGLSGTTAAPSRLSAAQFNKASVQNVDMSNAQLYGAQFTNANLTNTSLAGSFLSANTAAVPPIKTAAVFDGAHLKNVSLANAQLQGASFHYTSFYGSFGGGTPAFPCKTTCARPGFTCSCATASGANLTGAIFSNAYLFGVDFTGATTTINGTQFGSAILTGASFSGAQFQVSGGAAPDFTKALLQGTIFDSNANLVNTSLWNAFVDFGAATNTSQGNILYLLLSSDYTGFKGWSGSGTPCVQAAYGNFTAVPPTVSMTCPNSSSTVCGAGKPAPSTNANWKGGILMAGNQPVPGWYLADATYDKASDPTVICKNNATVDPNW